MKENDFEEVFNQELDSALARYEVFVVDATKLSAVTITCYDDEGNSAVFEQFPSIISKPTESARLMFNELSLASKGMQCSYGKTDSGIQWLAELTPEGDGEGFILKIIETDDLSVAGLVKSELVNITAATKSWFKTKFS